MVSLCMYLHDLGILNLCVQKKVFATKKRIHCQIPTKQLLWNLPMLESFPDMHTTIIQRQRMHGEDLKRKLGYTNSGPELSNFFSQTWIFLFLAIYQSDELNINHIKNINQKINSYIFDIIV